jgi:oligopeptide transport system substrate-binding protein
MKDKKILRINIQDEPQSLDPRMARDLNSITLMHMLFEGLARISKEGSAELALAEEMQTSEDGLTYTFRLRSALWSDGTPVTSYDFAQSWRRMLDPNFPTDLAYQLYVIKGARESKNSGIDQLAVETPDPQTLIVSLETPIPYLLELLTFPSFFPVPHRMDAENSHWTEDHSKYVSNGPFVLKTWEHSNKILVARNPKYWDEKNVYLKGIEMVMVNPETELRMFKDCQLDWAGSPLSTLPPDAVGSLKQSRDLQVRPLTGTYFLRINTEGNALLSHPLFRRALAFAIDRQSITEHILQGGQLPATALVPPAMGLSANGYFNDADPLKAADLLSLFCEREDLSKENLPSIDLLYMASERNHMVAMTIKQQIESALGIRVSLEAAEKKLFYVRVSKKQYQMAAGSWIADFNDPINFLDVFKFKDGSTNNTGWENSKYVDCLNRSVLCNDSIERKKILREAERLLLDQMPLIPIFHYALNYLQKTRLEDITLSPIGQIDFRWCKLEETPTR